MSTRPTLRLAAALVGAALATSCGGTPSPVDPSADVEISGQVVGADGRPVKGAEVRVVAGGGFSDLLGLVPVLRWSCVGGGCAGLDETLRTGADGRVRVRTKGQETRTPAGNARAMALVAVDAADPPEGALGRGGAVQHFLVLQEQVALPPLALWRTAVSAASAGSRLRISFTPLADPNVKYGWDFADLQGNSLVDVDLGGGRTVDARLLEDFPGRMAVTAALEGAAADTAWRSPVYPYQGTLRPPSRGAACIRRDRAGKATVHRPCGLTDGSLRTTGPVPSDDCVDLSDAATTLCRDRAGPVDIDLGRAHDISLVVVRGVQFTTPVLTSVDGVTWTPLGRDEIAPDSKGTLVLESPPRPARYVRLAASGEETPEVAVW